MVFTGAAPRRVSTRSGKKISLALTLRFLEGARGRWGVAGADSAAKFAPNT